MQRRSPPRCEGERGDPGGTDTPAKDGTPGQRPWGLRAPLGSGTDWGWWRGGARRVPWGDRDHPWGMLGGSRQGGAGRARSAILAGMGMETGMGWGDVTSQTCPWYPGMHRPPSQSAHGYHQTNHHSSTIQPISTRVPSSQSARTNSPAGQPIWTSGQSAVTDHPANQHTQTSAFGQAPQHLGRPEIPANQHTDS